MRENLTRIWIWIWNWSWIWIWIWPAYQESMYCL